MLSDFYHELVPFVDIAKELDRADHLASYRHSFSIPENTVYLDGNSLGLLSNTSRSKLEEVVESWGNRGISGWTEGDSPWFTMAEDLGKAMAPLVGCPPETVIATGSTTVNLHQLLATLYNPKTSCKSILTDATGFPSDLYAMRSFTSLVGLPDSSIVLVEPDSSGFLDEERIIEAMCDRDVQLVVLPSVVYTTGQLLNMQLLTTEAHRLGICIGFDCAHSVGVIPHHLDSWGVDFAFWCGYKYLNGGPGATAGLYLNARHTGKNPGLAGWFGSDKSRQFEMSAHLIPAVGAAALQIGTPNILSMAPLLGSVNTISEAGVNAIRTKSLGMTALLIGIIDVISRNCKLEMVTPTEDNRRGGHIAVRHPQARAICESLKQLRVVADHRPPDIIRFSPAPLYNSYLDCVSAMNAMYRVSQTEIPSSSNTSLIP